MKGMLEASGTELCVALKRRRNPRREQANRRPYLPHGAALHERARDVVQQARGAAQGHARHGGLRGQGRGRCHEARGRERRGAVEDGRGQAQEEVVAAVPHLRCGEEYGEEWGRRGREEKGEERGEMGGRGSEGERGEG